MQIGIGCLRKHCFYPLLLPFSATDAWLIDLVSSINPAIVLVFIPETSLAMWEWVLVFGVPIVAVTAIFVTLMVASALRKDA